MSPVSALFHTVGTVRIGLKTQFCCQQMEQDPNQIPDLTSDPRFVNQIKAVIIFGNKSG